ncbi:NRT2.5, partial [Symbiodinium sp. KB8]
EWRMAEIRVQIASSTATCGGSWRAPFTTPAAGQPPPRNLRTTSHGLPPLFQKGSYWNPEREQDVECNPGAAQYLRTCLDEGVLPDLLPFLTGHSAKLEAASRELTDKDLGAITAMLGRVATAKVIDLSNNPLLTDKSMAPFLDALLRQQLPATVARLSLANCHALSLKTATKLASLVESDQAARLRTLDLTGVRLSLAAQVHISGTIREHDELRELKLANTNISGRDCLHVLLANDRLQLIDLSWNSFDEHCFATIGELLVKNVSLHTLACSNSSTPSGKRLTPIVRLLEALSGISNLQQLDLAADQIDYRAALVLEDVLGDHPKLRRLVLAQNPLGILGCRSMLRLLCSQASCLRSVDFAGCFADAQGRLEQTGPGFRPNSPGGTYQLDFTQPYHRSIMRMLAKTAERLNLQIADALTPLAGATTLPEKTPAGLWTVPTAGGTRIKFNMEKAMGRSLGDRWDFHGLLAEQSQLLRCRLPAAKQLQLFKQFSTLRMQIQEQVVFLNALAKDFLLEPSQILQLGFEREIAEEVVWRLLPCTAGAKERYLTVLAAPTFRGYISALQHSHSLLNLNVQNPSGHYRLDLANPSDAFVGQQLLRLDRWEGVLRQELRRKDTSRMFGSCIFNALYLEKRIDSGPMNDWPWPEHGLLALDYASGKRPTAEDSAVATPSFRNLCQALHLCSLTEEQKVAALVPVSHELFLSSLQLRTLLLLLETPNARLQLFELLYLRIVDIQNQTLARDVLDESCNFCKLERFNQCMMFPFVQPESFAFEFNLKHLDHRLASLAVFKLCEVEGWANLPEPAFVADEADEDGTDEALFWRSSKEVDESNKATELPLLRVCGTVQQNPHMRAFWGSVFSFFLAFLGWFALAPLGLEVATSINMCENQKFPPAEYPLRPAYLKYKSLKTGLEYCQYGKVKDGGTITDCAAVPADVMSSAT